MPERNPAHTRTPTPLGMAAASAGTSLQNKIGEICILLHNIRMINSGSTLAPFARVGVFRSPAVPSN
jgi:hypothetical protein